MEAEELFMNACKTAGGDVWMSEEGIKCTLKSRYREHTAKVATLTMSEKGILVDDGFEGIGVSPQSLKIALEDGYIEVRNPIKKR